MAQNIIELGFDIEAITAQKKQVLDLFVDLFGKLQEYDGTKINPLGGGGLGDLKKSINDGAKAMSDYQQVAAKYNQTVTEQAQRQAASKKALEDLTAEQREAKKIQDQLAATQAKIALSSTDAAKELAQQKLQLQQLTAENKNAAKEAGGLVTAYQKLEAEFKAAANAAAEIGIAQGTSSDEYVDAAKKANTLNDQLKKLDEDSGKFGRNVGNYSGAFKEAFTVLKDQLAATKAELGGLESKGGAVAQKFGFDPNRYKGDVTSFTKTGGATAYVSSGDAAAYTIATQKADLLEKTVERLSIGFKTTRQESRAFEEAATQLGLKIGLESEEFQVFDKAVGHSKNAIDDIKAATKFQSQDAKLITGLASAASTLAGGFGAAQAAAALFGGESEDLQKQMAQFQQLLVLINGLQAVANGLQAESGGMQLLLSARTNLLNAAKGVQLLLTTRAIQAIATETGATALNAEVKEGAAVATGEQAVAEGVQTVATIKNTEATVANTVAQGAASGGVKKLTTSLIAGGIATLLLAAGAGLALLTAKLIGFGNQAGLTTEQQEALAKATGDLNEALNQQAKIYDDLDASQRRYYTNLIQNAQDAGASQYALLLAQQRSDEAQKDAAKLEVDRLGASESAISKQAQRVQQLLSLQQLASEEVAKISAIPEKDQTGKQKKALESDLKLLSVYAAQLGPEQKKFDDMRNARDKLAETTQKVASDETRFNKLSLDEQLEVTEKTETLRANLVKARNAIVLGSEASTLQLRLAAIRSNIKQENDIIDAQAKRIQDTPGNKLNGLLTPQAQLQIDALNEKRKEGAIKGAEDIRKLNREYYERDRDAALASYRTQIEQQIKLAQDLQQGKRSNSNPLEPAPKVGLSDRLSGLSQEYEARRDLLNAELKVELDKEGQTAAEKKAIYDKYGADIADLGRDFKKTYLDLEKEAQEESLREWELYYEKRKTEIDQNEIAQIRLLDDARQKDLISIRKYNRDKQKAEDEAALARAQTAANNAYLERNSTKEGTKERAEAEERLTEVVKGLNNQVTNNRIHGQDAQRDKIVNTLNDIEANYKNSTEAIGNILDIGYEAQKTRLANLETLQEKNYEKGVKQVQDSTGTEEEKAARLKVLDSQRMAEKEANDRKLRQMEIERAQFEKAASIASIALDTTKAIVGFLHNPGGFAGIALSVTAGILGAAQLAKAIATPVPHYKTGAGINGKPLHSGGLAIVGDGYEPELINEPGKRPYLSAAVPTMLDLSPMTSVVPISMLDDMSRMWVTDRGILSYQNDNSELSSKLDRLNNTMVWMAGSLKESAKNNRPRVVIHNHIGDEVKHRAWAQKNVFD